MKPQVTQVESPAYGAGDLIADNPRWRLFLSKEHGLLLKIRHLHNVGDPEPAPDWYRIDVPR